jgi:cation diffusion facilitator CzcD-associated flavoprotein CzcO/acetyl esterase/lipase
MIGGKSVPEFTNTIATPSCWRRLKIAPPAEIGNWSLTDPNVALVVSLTHHRCSPRRSQTRQRGTAPFVMPSSACVSISPMGTDTHRDTAPLEHDVVVVGAGMAGLYLLHRLREAGMSAIALEAADDVGGTWYWNRYPGARCDVQSIDYSFSWDPDLDAEWQWSEKYATQPEILRYLQFIADKHDLRRDIRFETKVSAARWDDPSERWHIRTEDGEELIGRHYVMATGCLSVPKDADIPGADRFQGDRYFTGRWPHEPVDFSGQRVAVIGTGSSAIQSIPIIAGQAAQLTVFQRTPNFSMPAHNGPVDPERAAAYAADPAAYREAARRSRAGVPGERPTRSALAVTDQERLAAYEHGWAEGGLFGISRQFNDLGVNLAANETAAEFVRDKIRSIVDDPATAETLCPRDYPFATKRPCVDTGYFATFNLPHVRLVDLRATPIATITESGIDLTAGDGVESLEFDAIVFAVGFDAMTGPIVAVDIEGRDGLTLKRKWADGPLTYLGLTTVGFPNLFLVTGPGSPSVLSNMVVSIEQHVDLIVDTLIDMREAGHTTIEPTPTAETGWVQHVNDCADITLVRHANSWYMGANVPGKPRVFLPYIGGVDTYRATCERVVEQNYLGFRLDGPGGEQLNDGVINRLQPDVMFLLQAMAELDLPALETLSPEGAREFMDAAASMRPAGPEVGEIVDGTLPGAGDNDLAYRLYRPVGDGPFPVVCYYHGGGWVLGSAESDDPFCREMCNRTGAIWISVDYRHAPESTFPAAAHDAIAALDWVAAHTADLGGIPGKLAVAGWSAGGNLAAVVAQHARSDGGPELAGQLLICPVTDVSTQHDSMFENADGYALTKPLMEWFIGHYAPDTASPLASPLLAESLAGLAPAAVFTAQFDPLRDEGNAYAKALESAGVPVTHEECRGHTHTAFHAVDILISPVQHRVRMAEAVRGFFGLS